MAPRQVSRTLATLLLLILSPQRPLSLEENIQIQNISDLCTTSARDTQIRHPEGEEEFVQDEQALDDTDPSPHSGRAWRDAPVPLVCVGAGDGEPVEAGRRAVARLLDPLLLRHPRGDGPRVPHLLVSELVPPRPFFLISVVVLLTERHFSLRIPIWYELKLLFLAWLALPNFRGAAFIYDRFVRDQLRKHGLTTHPGSSASASKKEDGGGKEKKSTSPSPKEKENAKSKFLSFVGSKKDHQEAH